jgi:fatty-acyl-CoA synthase
MLVTELITRGARQFGPRTAILFEDQSLTFTEADRLAAQIANTLLGPCRAHSGDRIGLFLGNSLYSIPTDFACAKAGLTRVPLNARLAEAEHLHMLSTAKVSLLIHDAQYTSRAEALQAEIPGLRRCCLETELLPGAADAPASDPEILHQPDDPVLALFTSGTSGKLKAALHTQSSWAAVAHNILSNLIDFQPGDIMLHAASMIHASGTFILPCWGRGATAAILSGFDPAAYLAAITRWRPTSCNLVPTMLAMLLEHPGIAQADLSSLRSIVYGASPMPRPVISRALALWGPRFIQYYGQTEAPLCIASLSAADHLDPVRQRACGRPAAECELRLVDEPGNDVGEGEVGEITVRAP